MKAAPGVIDCLSEGFVLVTRYLWVLLFPLALDAVLFFAPRITAQPLVERFLALYSQAAAESGGAALLGGTGLQTFQDSISSFGSTNLLRFLGQSPLNVAVPSLLARLSDGAGETLTITSVGDFLWLVLCAQLVGLFLACLYLGVLGQLVRDGRPSLSRLAGKAAGYWLTFLAIIGLMIGLIVAVFLVVFVLSIVSMSLAALVSAALTTAAFFVGMLLLIYLFFLTAAVVVGERRPLEAIRSSFRTVQTSFWSSIFLIALTFLIDQGMLVIWQGLVGMSWGVLVAVVGNAYVASGLTAANMLFYRSRAHRAMTPPVPVAGRDDASR